MTETLTEEKLSDIAEALAVDKKLPNLGLKLGFKQPTVQMYIATNKRNDSFEGTSSMLFDWKRKTPRAKQIPDLIQALCDSGFSELVDDFFPSEGAAARQDTRTETSSTGALNVGSTTSMDRIVKDSELLKLAGILPADSYTTLAIHLGFGYTDQDNITREKASIKDANFSMLMAWKRKENSGKVKDLDKALKNSDCGGLSYKEM